MSLSASPRSSPIELPGTEIALVCCDAHRLQSPQYAGCDRRLPSVQCFPSIRTITTATRNASATPSLSHQGVSYGGSRYDTVPSTCLETTAAPGMAQAPSACHRKKVPWKNRICRRMAFENNLPPIACMHDHRQP